MLHNFNHKDYKKYIGVEGIEENSLDLEITTIVQQDLDDNGKNLYFGNNLKYCD